MKLRTRERLAEQYVTPYVCKVRNDETGATRDVNRESIHYNFARPYELIADEAFENAGTGLGFCPTKVCFHYKHNLRVPSFSDPLPIAAPMMETWPLQVGDISQEVLYHHGLELTLPSLRRLVLEQFEGAMRAFHVDDANKNAMGNFKDPTMDRGFSLINFLIELAELGSLHGTFRHWRDVVRYALKGRSNMTFADALHLFGDAKLALDFGLLPLIRDVQKAMSILAKFDDADRRLRDLQGKALYQTLSTIQFDRDTELLRRLCPRSSMPTEVGGTGPFTTLSLQCGAQADVFVEYSHLGGPWCGFHNGIGYSYTLPEARGILARIRQYLDALGVGVDLSILWNATRFTFLIDWLCGVSGFLEETSLQMFPVDVNLHDCLNSMKLQMSRVIYVRAPMRLPDGSIINPMTEIFSESATVYDRRRVKAFPHLMPEIESGNIGLHQITLTGALLYTMGYRVYRRREFKRAAMLRNIARAHRKARRGGKPRPRYVHALDPELRKRWILEQRAETPLRYRRYLGRRFG